MPSNFCVITARESLHIADVRAHIWHGLSLSPSLSLAPSLALPRSQFMGDSAPPPFYELPKIRPCLVWVKDKSGTLVAGKEVAEDEGDMGSFVMTFPKKDSDAVFTAYALYSDGQVYASAPTA
jgi:hypothetical protein